jgi:hypothetical protein
VGKEKRGKGGEKGRWRKKSKAVRLNLNKYVLTNNDKLVFPCHCPVSLLLVSSLVIVVIPCTVLDSVSCYLKAAYQLVDPLALDKETLCLAITSDHCDPMREITYMPSRHHCDQSSIIQSSSY